MEIDLDLLASLDAELSDVFVVYQVYKLYKKYKKSRSGRTAKFWVHPINMQRDEIGTFASLMPELKADEARFQSYCRMSQKTFNELLYTIKDDITKEDTNFRNAIQPELKLMLALRYLATGQSFQSLHYQFRVGNRTARKAVYEVCTAIWHKLSPSEMAPPTKKDYIMIAQQFLDLWQFPNCLGAIGGQRIKIKYPNMTEMQFYKNKGTFSMVLQAITDANGNFEFVEVDDNGRHCNAGVFKYSSFGRALTDKNLPLPEDASTGESEPLPFVFLGDETYPLLKNLIKPYSRRGLDDLKRKFNYRQNRARRVVDCAFGMLTAKWGVLQNTMTITAEHAKTITLACCVLHNFVRRREGRPNFSDFELEEEKNFRQATEITNFGRPAQEALDVRQRFASLFVKT